MPAPFLLTPPLRGGAKMLQPASRTTLADPKDNERPMAHDTRLESELADHERLSAARQVGEAERPVLPTQRCGTGSLDVDASVRDRRTGGVHDTTGQPGRNRPWRLSQAREAWYRPVRRRPRSFQCADSGIREGSPHP